jgi:hypothetical protein
MDHYQTCCDGRGAGGHTVAVTAPGIGNGAGSHEKQRKGSKWNKENGGGRRVKLEARIASRSHIMVLRQRTINDGVRRPFQAAEEAVNRARGDAAVKRLMKKRAGRKY